MTTSGSGGDKRRQIVETAYRLFRRDGYHATGIDRIIAEAGVAKMTMYRHFPGKDDLIVAVLRMRAARFDAQLDRLAATAETPAAKLDTIVGWYARWFRRPDFHGCAFAHAIGEFAAPDHPVHAAAVAQKDGFRGRLRGIIAEALPAERAEAVATGLFVLFEGATLLAHAGRREEAIATLRTLVPAVAGVPGGVA